MLKIYLLILFFFVSLATAANAAGLKVYKHVDKDGIIHYSSRKPVGKSFHVLQIKCPECKKWRSAINWHTTPLVTGKFDQEIKRAASKWGVDTALIRAIIHAESSFKHQAVSSAGAQGLMQLMPFTQQTYKVSNPYNPSQNIDAGVAYLKYLMGRYHSLEVSLAAYNSGETAVERYGKTIPPFDETREYIRRVKILRDRYKLIKI